MSLRFRQVHLDFHTSPEIPDIGKAFNRKKWQETLKSAHVDSITCFSKCHHGWSYHPTEVGRIHPHLDFDLLRAQFEACKEIDINVPIYISAGFDNMITDKHPEWRECSERSGYPGNMLRAGFHRMCFNSPYLDYLCEQIEEVVNLFPDCDGIFLDIINQDDCCCSFCLRQMKETGLDPFDPADRKKVAAGALAEYFRRSTAAARSVKPDMPVFHNSGHIKRGNREILRYFSHLELESLPTGGWGYDHFPLSAKYCSGLDMDFLGMTGKFHTSWGEFGGFKHPNALRYECAAMTAYGARCSVGDQLHPAGELDESTYEIIGRAYREVESKEPWLGDAETVADIGLFSSESVNDTHRFCEADEGAARILLEGHYLFDVIDREMSFEKYRLIILPDNIPVDADLKSRLDVFLENGGKIFLTGDSGIGPEGDPVFDTGCTHEGMSPFQPDFILPGEDTAPDFVKSPFVMYLPSRRIRAVAGKSLGKVLDPYFNRHVFHFCSHQHAPHDPASAEYDCGVLHNNIFYLAHPVFRIYRGCGAVAVKRYIMNALNLLLGGNCSIETNLPSTARVSLARLTDNGNYVLHLLYAGTISRGGKLELPDDTVRRAMQTVEVVEELLPLRDTRIRFSRGLGRIKKAVLQPDGREASLRREENADMLEIEEFNCHAMIELVPE